MAIVLLFTFFYAGINLVVDLLYGVIDPRIRLGAGRRGARERATAPRGARPEALGRRGLGVLAALPAGAATPARRRVVLLVMLVAIGAPLLAPHRYDETDLLAVWAAPSRAHVLGRRQARPRHPEPPDRRRADLARRGGVGARDHARHRHARGMVAGYFGGWADALLMRAADIILAFPELVFAILVAAVLGPGMRTVIVALSIVWWPGIARLTRSLVLVLRSELFVDAAIVAGRGR